MEANKQLDEYMKDFLGRNLDSKIKRIKDKVANDLGFEKWEGSLDFTSKKNLELIENEMMKLMVEPKVITNSFSGKVTTGTLLYVDIDDYRFSSDDGYVVVTLMRDEEHIVLDEGPGKNIYGHNRLTVFAVEWLVKNVRVEEDTNGQ